MIPGDHLSDLRRPLLIHPGALGDLIRLTAMARSLARRWGAPCDLVTRHPAAPEVFAGLDSVATIHRWPSRSRPYRLDPVQWRLAGWLRRRPTSAVYLIEERVHRIVPWRAATRMEWLLQRAGVRRDRIVAARDHPREPLEHFVEYGRRLSTIDPAACTATTPWSAPAATPAPELAVSAQELGGCRRWLAERGLDGPPLLVLQTVSRRRDRGRWPQAKWRALVDWILAREPSTRVLLLGTRAEARATAELAAACADPRVHDVAGQVPLRRLFALLTLSHSCISLDTGPAHAAAALGCPLVMLAGRADPRRNRPTGAGERALVVTAWPDHRWPDSPLAWYAGHDIAQIAVPAVFAAWRSLISEPAARPALAAAVR